MPARSKFSSPTLVLQITEEARDKAIASNSGGCLIADAIKTQYPHLTNIAVDMATVRASDRKAGLRYTYLQTSFGQHCLLSFDQGWPNPVAELIYRRAVKIDRITRYQADLTRNDAHRAERLAELEAKEVAGTLTGRDRQVLSRYRNYSGPRRPRPASKGPIAVSGRGNATVVAGGRALTQGPAHPNLLRGRNRHFGAKLADPGQAFNEAVEAAVEERLQREQTEFERGFDTVN